MPTAALPPESVLSNAQDRFFKAPQSPATQFDVDRGIPA
jgi:hypothetical protein